METWFRVAWYGYRSMRITAGKWITVRTNDHLGSCNTSETQLCGGKDQRWSGYKSDVKLPPRLTDGLFGLNYFQTVELDTASIIVCLFFVPPSVLFISLLLEFTLS